MDPQVMVTTSEGSKDLAGKIFYLKGCLLFPPYFCPDGLGKLSNRNIKRLWKYYQGLLQNTYHGWHIETNHFLICSTTKDFSKNFAFNNVFSQGQGH